MDSAARARVAVLFGGYWEEREVSIESASHVVEALTGSGLQVDAVRWDPEGWTLVPEDDLRTTGQPEHPLVLLQRLREDGLGVVFNALHGGPGESGAVQGFFEVAGVPYSGAGVHASAVTLNKVTFRRLASELDFDVAPGMVVGREAWRDAHHRTLTDLSVDVGFPAVVKPVASGSSVGVTRVEDVDEASTAIDRALQRDRSILVEQFISGREVTIPCLGTRVGEAPQVLPIVEIEPLTDTGFFDFDAKYDPERVREIVPASLDDELRVYLESLALTLHRELELGGVSRTDVILGADGPVVLETQTVPGLTRESLLPKSAAAAGLDMPALCRRLIDFSLSAYLARGAESVNVASPEE